MPITELLEENARKYGNDVALVEVNPQVQETRRVLWKDYDLIQPTSSFWYRREITWHVFDEKANRFAQLLMSRGVKKGDKVMTVLKRHWQMWIVTFALEKIGAILIPATNQLKKKDYTYRFKSGDIKHIIATGDGDVRENIEKACAEYPLELKFIVKTSEHYDGWIDFDAELMNYPDTLERIATNVDDD